MQKEQFGLRNCILHVNNYLRTNYIEKTDTYQPIIVLFWHGVFWLQLC